MKKTLLLLIAISTLVSGTAFAKEYFTYRFRCIDNNVVTYSHRQHERLSTYTSFFDDDVSYNQSRDCDTVCIQLYGTGATSITNTNLYRVKKILEPYAYTTLNTYGGYDYRYDANTYCWADWNNDYLAVYYNPTTNETRETTVTFEDGDGSTHYLRLVPHLLIPTVVE